LKFGKSVAVKQNLGTVYNLRYYRNDFVSTNKLLEITNELTISPEEIEKFIIAVGNKGAGRGHDKSITINARFPYRYTPLDHRLIFHMLGDGTMASNSWSQISKESMRFFQTLLEQRGVNSVKPNGRTIIIPQIFLYLAAAVVKLPPQLISTPEFIRRSIGLPRKHRIQALLALIHDDGSVGYGSTVIHRDQKLEVVEAVVELWDSTYGRETRFNLLEEKPHPGSRVIKRGGKVSIVTSKNPVWYFKANRAGLRLLYRDVLKMIDEYGITAGLWKKQKLLEQDFIDEKLSKGAKKILSFCISSKIFAIGKRYPISPKVVAERFKINYLRAQSIIHNLHKRGLLKRVRKGWYVSTDLTPVFPRTAQILLLLESKKLPLSRGEIALCLRVNKKLLCPYLWRLEKAGLIDIAHVNNQNMCSFKPIIC